MEIVDCYRRMYEVSEGGLMKREKKAWICTSLFVAAMAVVLIFSGFGSAKAQGLSEAQKEKESLEKELKDAQAMIDGLKDSKEDMEDTVKKLDEKLRGISKKISELENQLIEKQQEVDQTQEELQRAQEDREKQYQDMKLRIQFLYENQTVSTLERILSSKSIAEFLNNAEYVSQISQYDRNMLVKYEETVESIAKMEETLEAEISELQSMKQKVEEEQKAVAALVQEKEKKLTETEGEIVDAQQLAEVYEAELQAQNEIIGQIQAAEAERLRQLEEANKTEENKPEADGKNVDSGSEESKNPENEATGNETAGNETAGNQKPENEGGGNEIAPSSFNWPCPSSTRVTSDYGPRESPTAGASSYHRGIDIGAAHGADIVSVADGTVVFAGYSASAGNYLTISHGGGLYTVYMHCSSLVASNGQKVSRGQVIAKVGSTGISTGNHLHFGVSLSGSYVNPWNYL